MKKGRFLWSAHRITEKQKAGKARNIKEKQLKNSRNTASRPHVARRSSASAKFPLASFPREGCDPCNTTRAAMPSWQCGTGFLVFRL
jgi:hypothetical protein